MPGLIRYLFLSLFIMLINVTESYAAWSPENQVSDIVSDGEYLWVATKYEGLAKFNKTTGAIEWFTIQNSDLPNDQVHSTIIGPENKLYVTTAGGFAVYDGMTWETVLLDDERNSFRDVKFDSQGNLWVLGARDIHRFDGATWKKYTTMMGGDSGSNHVFDFQSDGTVWIVRDGITTIRGDSVNTDVKRFLFPLSVAVDSDDWVWLGLYAEHEEGGLVKTNGTDWFTYDASNTNFPGGRINCLHFDKTGTLWAGATNWVGTFDGVSTWTVYDSTGCAYLRDTSVQDLLVEDDGTLWLGTTTHGLLKFDGTTWTQYDVIPEATGIMEEQRPAEFSLSPAFPNPFNPKTTIGYTLPKPGNVTLAVYDVTGKKVATLVDGEISEGKHEIQFDGAGLASGLYFYRIQAEGFAKTGKMLLMK